jgi:hypothetical protein
MEYVFIRLIVGLIVVGIINLIIKQINKGRRKENTQRQNARDEMVNKVRSLIEQGEIEQALGLASFLCLNLIKETDSFFAPEIFYFFRTLFDIVRTHAGTVLTDFDRKNVDLAMDVFVDLSRGKSYPEKDIARASKIISTFFATIIKETDPENKQIQEPLPQNI